MRGVSGWVRTCLLSTVGTAALVAAFPAGAGAQSVGLEEITVTAQKRSETAQKVPISISALSGETLERTGVNDVTDIVRSVPGMSFGNSLPGRSNVSIRGVVAASGAPTVGVYVDEYSLPSGFGGDEFVGSTDVRVFDLARVEVLRGPQGTLYGAGSMGGTIRYITTAPSLEGTSGRVQGGLSSTKSGGLSYRAAGAIGTAIVPGVLGIRVSAMHEQQSGYIDRVDQNGNRLKKNADDAPSTALRAVMLWQPDDSWEITPSVSYQKVATDSEPSISSNQAGFRKVARFDEPVEDRNILTGLTVKKKLGGIELVSATSYFDRRFDITTDYTDTNLNSIAGTLQSPALAAPFRDTASVNFTRSTIKVFSQELRVASADDTSPLRWQIGGYYANQKRNRYQIVTDPNFNTIAQRNNISLRAVNDWIFIGETRRNQKSYALFGDASYKFGDRLTVSAGVRRFKTDGELLRANGGLFGGGAFTVLAPLENSEKGTNPKFTVDLQATENSMVYATASKGFRSGAPNTPLPGNNACITSALSVLGLTAGPASYASDSLWNYEAGIKNNFLGNRLMLNASGYYIDWSGIPQAVPLVSATGQSCGYSFTSNVGKSSVRGGELEAKVKVADPLTLGFTVGYSDAKVGADAASLGAKKGDRLQLVPRFTYTLSADLFQPLQGDYALIGRIDHSWRGEAKRNFNRTSVNYSQESYGTTNLSVGVETKGWSVEMFVRNLFDQAPILNDNVWLNTSAFYQGYRDQATLRPRTIGVTGNYKF